ncbi:MAG: hypothetical protein LWX55_15590 [Deltaproteobacteria bacterium]|jgi:hypothetical protein|nr:hypothetical protein [Deltaproteobacteria bacterium]
MKAFHPGRDEHVFVAFFYGVKGGDIKTETDKKWGGRQSPARVGSCLPVKLPRGEECSEYILLSSNSFCNYFIIA